MVTGETRLNHRRTPSVPAAEGQLLVVPVQPRRPAPHEPLHPQRPVGVARRAFWRRRRLCKL